jgi:hypothetical protein
VQKVPNLQIVRVGNIFPLEKYAAQILMVNPMFASKAIQENCICMAKIANNADNSGRVSDFLNSLTRKYVPRTAKIPMTAEGNRTANTEESEQSN